MTARDGLEAALLDLRLGASAALASAFAILALVAALLREAVTGPALVAALCGSVSSSLLALDANCLLRARIRGVLGSRPVVEQVAVGGGILEVGFPLSDEDVEVLQRTWRDLTPDPDRTRPDARPL